MKKQIKQRMQASQQFEGQSFSKKSSTIPGQDLTPQEILRQFTKSGQLGKELYFNDNISQFDKMDILEKLDYLRDLKEQTTNQRLSLDLKIKELENQIRSKNNLEGLYSWFNELPEEFTLSELNKVLSTSYQATSLVYFDKTPQPQSKPKSNSSNPNKKSNKTNLTVKLNVDMLFDQPVIEETKEEVYIFSGRTTVYFNKDLGIYGIATVNSNELNTYCKEM